MTWQHLEKIFNRALSKSFSKRKFFLVFPVLALCGLLAVICRAISANATQWIIMSASFLPIFLCAGLLLAVGIVLTRIYHHEVKGAAFQYLSIIKGAKNLFLGIPYLAVPLIFAYLILWMVLGIFYLLRAIPHVGEFVGSILSFGPFLLVIGSIVLGVLSLLTLFAVTPAAALRSDLSPKLAEEVFREMNVNPFLNCIFLFIALLPLLLTILVLTMSALVTHTLYVESSGGLFVILKWFFMMVPFSALLTPTVIFFFNFACESYVFRTKPLLSKK